MLSLTQYYIRQAGGGGGGIGPVYVSPPFYQRKFGIFLRGPFGTVKQVFAIGAKILG
jgi:hypothetical protein